MGAIRNIHHWYSREGQMGGEQIADELIRVRLRRDRKARCPQGPRAMKYLEERLAAPGIVELVMSQPGKKNAMNAAMREALTERIEALATDPGVAALILSGARRGSSVRAATSRD